MARAFAALTTPAGATVYINIDNVTTISRDGDLSLISMADGQQIAVSDDARFIARSFGWL